MPLNASSGFRAVQAAAEAAAIPWPVGPHTLRHTFATRCFRAGWNAKQVQLALGHHSPAFTLSTYVHLIADDLPDALALPAEGGNTGASSGAETGRYARARKVAES